MDKLNLIFQQFNTREIAIIIWLLVVIVVAVFLIKDIRKTLIDILKNFFHKKIFLVIISSILYTGLVVFILYKIKIWDWSFLKDTIYWFTAVAFVLLINTNKATQDKRFFIKILKDNLKIILVLQFILAFYTFNLLAEIIFVPILVFVGVMSAFAETKKEYLPVKKIFDFILSAIGIFFIIFAFGKIFSDFQSIATSDNLKTFILPPLLTFAFIPFVYFFAIIMSYETLFVRLSIFNKNEPKLIKFTKRKIIRACHLNLPRLNYFAKENNQELMKIKTKEDVNVMMKKYFKE